MYFSPQQARPQEYQQRSNFDWIRRWWYWKTHRPPLWCFRSVKCATDPSSPWRPFSRHNQSILWQALYQHYNKEVQLIDPFIEQGKEIVRVIVHEELAFVIDPESAQPILYDVALLPIPPKSFWRQ